MKLTARYILGLIMTAAVIVLAAWLPSRIVGSQLTDIQSDSATTAQPAQTVPTLVESTLQEKMDLVIKYVYALDGVMNRRGGENADFEDLFMAVADNLFNIFVFDEEADEVYSTDMAFQTLYDAQGRYVEVFDFYCEWAGDWNNWIRLCMDKETGMVYYFYISSGLQKNLSKYTNPTEDVWTQDYAAECFTGAIGGDWCVNLGDDLYEISCSGTSESMTEGPEPEFDDQINDGLAISIATELLTYSIDYQISRSESYNLFEFKATLVP